MDFAGKGIVITGGSKGLGRALAGELGRRRARLVLVARDRERLERAVVELREQGHEAHALAADVAAKESTYPLAGAAQALLGRVDVVIHAASALGPSPLRLLADTDCEDLERAVAVNLVGPFRLTKALFGPMALHGDGLVVHVSSDAAVEGYPTWGAYGVSKAAFDHMARIWGAEAAPFGVRFVAVDPGDMDTDLHEEAVPGSNRDELQDPRDVARRLVAWLEQDPPSGGRYRLGGIEALR